MSDDVHVRLGGKLATAVHEVTKLGEPEVTEVAFNGLVEDVGSLRKMAHFHDGQLTTHEKQLSSLEHRADALSEWMGAIKEWVPQQTGAIAAQVHTQDERLAKLEAAEIRLAQAKSVNPAPNPNPMVSLTPQKNEKELAHYFGEKVENLTAAFNDLEEKFHVHTATVRDQVKSHAEQPHYAPKSRLPLWVTVGLTFSTEIVHLFHYLSHLH